MFGKVEINWKITIILKIKETNEERRKNELNTFQELHRLMDSGTLDSSRHILCICDARAMQKDRRGN